MPLPTLFERAPEGLWRRLATGTGLRLPVRTVTYGQTSLALVPLGLLLAIAAGAPPTLFGGLAIAATGLAFFALDRHSRSMPAGLATVGEFVDRTAALNASRLAEIGVRPPGVWETLSGMVRECAGRPPLKLDRSTLLLAPRR
ncbi:MAG: hypothetical protein IT534_08185 [Bauldia sp.]|nr:hypothetical protein [Bauldia sp.]